jgi:hypothetical protein
MAGTNSNKILIPAHQTLTQFVDANFSTDVVVANLTSNNNLTSSSLAIAIDNVFTDYKVSGSFANDAAAAVANIPVGGVYHTAGVVKVRLT